MSDLTLVATDTSPSINGTLRDNAGTVLDLTGTSVRFRMRLANDGRYMVDAPASIVSPTAGTVRYDFEDNDLLVPGEYIARWQITFPDTSTQHSEPENTITVDPA